MRRARARSGVVVLLVVLAACSSRSTASAPAGPATSTTATGPTGGPSTGLSSAEPSTTGATTGATSGTPSATTPSPRVATSAPASPSSSASGRPEAACPGPVPASAGLDPFYGRYCDVLGIPLVASTVVSPKAMRTAAAYMRRMLAHRPDVARVLAASTVRVGVIGRAQRTTQMPEWSDLNTAFPDTDWDERARGLGATVDRPLVGAGEENLLCLPEDRYLGESIFVHELSHTVLEFGAQAVDPAFRGRVETAYADAMAAGRWKGTYAATNADEYWAEAAQSFFDTNLADDVQHNSVDTRVELRRYDPAVYRLLVDVFGTGTWRPRCP